jgi:hypothetical protein
MNKNPPKRVFVSKNLPGFRPITPYPAQETLSSGLKSESAPRHAGKLTITNKCDIVLPQIGRRNCMEKNCLWYHAINLARLPFRNGNGIKWASLYYVHHDMVPEEINETLEGRGLTPANEDQLRAIFEKNDDILTQIEFRVILATEGAKYANDEKIPCIAKNDQNQAYVTSFICRQGILWGHSEILVLGIEN